MDFGTSVIIDLYRKRNRVKLCFRSINSSSVAFPVYDWTNQKIKVYMFLSLMEYMFLEIICNDTYTVMKKYSAYSKYII